MRLALGIALLPAVVSLGGCSRSSGERTSAVASPTPLVAEVTPAPISTPAPAPPAPTPAVASPTPLVVEVTPAPASPAAPALPMPTPAAPAPTPAPTLGPVSAPALVAPAPTLVPESGVVTNVIPTASTVHVALNVTPQEARYGRRLAAPQDPPRIFRMEISDDAPTTGEAVSGKVVTTTNVAAVTLSIAGMSMGMHRQDAGIFTLTYTVPRLPFFLKRWYTLDVTATTADGRTAGSSLPIHVR